MTTRVPCPTCRRPVEWTPASAHRPFCSERCRLVDLGGWLAERHRIPDASGDALEGPHEPPLEPPEA